MMRVAFSTLGCKLNQVESEAVADAFRKAGFEPAESSQEAELYIVNTCTVTSKAEQKARRVIRKFLSGPGNPVVLATGCYVQMESNLAERIGRDLLLLPLDRKASLLKLPAFLSQRLGEGLSLQESMQLFLHDAQINDESSVFDYEPARFTFHSRAFLKIEDGCDNTCSYCRVRIARGPAMSLDMKLVLQRAAELERRGYLEIVLTGVNISAYRDGNASLPELLFALDGVLDRTRIRLSSIEPDMLTPAMMEAFGLKQVQPHIHLPIQSASDSVIRTIGRSYTFTQLAESIAQLRSVKDDPFIAADMITGLPGETDGDFLRTMDLVKQSDITRLHVFPYSPRPGTKLWGASDQIAEHVRGERASALRELSDQQYRKYLFRHHGKVLQALAEQETSSGDWHALTDNYLHCRVQADHRLSRGVRFSMHLDASGEIPRGELVQVH